MSTILYAIIILLLLIFLFFLMLNITFIWDLICFIKLHIIYTSLKRENSKKLKNYKNFDVFADYYLTYMYPNFPKKSNF